MKTEENDEAESTSHLCSANKPDEAVMGAETTTKTETETETETKTETETETPDQLYHCSGHL